jgi:Cu(I)/Ag(I) efflux system membrane fusion protein
MHLEYIQNAPGKCPVCGMLLAPAGAYRETDKSLASSGRAPVKIRPDHQRALGIHVAEVHEVALEKTIRAVGHVYFGEPSRFTSEQGGVVREVYRTISPVGGPRLRRADAILSLSTSDVRISEATIVRALKPLVLLSVPQPGQRVEKGNNLYTYIDLSLLSVLADIRTPDMQFAQIGVPAYATLPSHPGKVWRGRITEATQQFDERTQTLRVKVDFPNDEADIWPGMIASVELRCPVRRALAIPESAVVENGETAIVFIAKPGDIFEPKPVELGLRANGVAEIRRGLHKGERVVASATFLMDAESQLRAAAITR